MTLVHSNSHLFIDQSYEKGNKAQAHRVSLLALLNSFGFYRGLPRQIFLLHLFLSSASSSSVISTNAMSSLTASIYLILGFPRFLFPGVSIFCILLPMRNRARFATSRQHLTHQFITTCIVTRLLRNKFVNKTTGACKS